MKKILIAIIILVLVAAAVGFLYMNKPHRDISEAHVDFKISAQKMQMEFDQNELEANNKYFDKVVEVEGSVSALNNDAGSYTIVLEAVVSGELVVAEGSTDLVGKNVTIKGLYTGYDDLLGEIKLRDCTILNVE